MNLSQVEVMAPVRSDELGSSVALSLLASFQKTWKNHLKKHTHLSTKYLLQKEQEAKKALEVKAQAEVAKPLGPSERVFLRLLKAN